MINIKKIQVALVICCMSAVFIIFGCGKKGPPIPPTIKGNIVAAPYDLKYEVGGSELALSWQHQIDKKKAKIEPDGFEVFMAKKTFKDCEGCPFAFKLIGFISMPGTTLIVPIQKGYKYYFRVQAVDEAGIKSEYSKTVQFESK
ncbi:MAG: hypothetical protein L3J69_11920 [Desulfobacula sp.]|nr:hypothetical protein [Desulfobacula sp.]